LHAARHLQSREVGFLEKIMLASRNLPGMDSLEQAQADRRGDDSGKR